MDKEKARKKIEDWVKGIPASEMNVPYFHIQRKEGSQLVSPAKAMDKLSKEQKTMNFIASNIADQLDPDTETKLITEDIDDLVREQLKARLENMPEEFKQKFRVKTDGKEENIETIYGNMIRGTKEGKQRFEIYKKVYLDLISKLGD